MENTAAVAPEDITVATAAVAPEDITVATAAVAPEDITVATTAAIPAILMVEDTMTQHNIFAKSIAAAIDPTKCKIIRATNCAAAIKYISMAQNPSTEYSDEDRADYMNIKYRDATFPFTENEPLNIVLAFLDYDYTEPTAKNYNDIRCPPPTTNSNICAGDKCGPCCGNYKDEDLTGITRNNGCTVNTKLHELFPKCITIFVSADNNEKIDTPQFTNNCNIINNSLAEVLAEPQLLDDPDSEIKKSVWLGGKAKKEDVIKIINSLFPNLAAPAPVPAPAAATGGKTRRRRRARCHTHHGGRRHHPRRRRTIKRRRARGGASVKNARRRSIR